MTYKLIWSSRYGKETIEEDIETKTEAEYLQNEYMLAYREGSIRIVLVR